jgi:hypothetical protein
MFHSHNKQPDNGAHNVVLPIHGQCKKSCSVIEVDDSLNRHVKKALGGFELELQRSIFLVHITERGEVI